MSPTNQTLFSSLPLRAELLKALEAVNYVEMTPVQIGATDAILQKRDVLAQAETGSGKTAAFSIGILNKLDATVFKTQALVICPTRELSDQVAAEIRRLASTLANTRVVTLCGGKPMHDQLTSLKRAPHIVVGTPGRLKKHLEKGTLNLDDLETLVLDEADRMLDMGFYDDIMSILNQSHPSRQTLLFSATYPDEIVNISGAIQNNPQEVRIEKAQTAQQIQQVFVKASDKQKPDMLLRALSKYKPENAIIFCNRITHVQALYARLKEQGISARALHGDLDQRERDEAIILFANKSISYLIATDVAARGLDISALSAVINYDLTPDPETHTHRIGRTGRAGLEGLAVSFVNPDDIRRAPALEDYSSSTVTFENLPEISNGNIHLNSPVTRTMAINAGKKDKIRPGDIVGALTANEEIGKDDIGKISVQAKISFVAVNTPKAKLALSILSEGKIKKRKFRVRLIA